MNPAHRAFLPFLDELADVAAIETLSAAKAGRVDDKGGDRFDPVTEADRAAEQAMRLLIAKRFPDHGIGGEEFAATAGTSRFSWSLDPVDGTRQLICGLPLWTTLIALLDQGRPVLGMIAAPQLGERYAGWCNGAALRAGGGETRLRTSGCEAIGEARLATTDPFLFDEAEFERFFRLSRQVLVTRYGGDGYAYARLAAGSIDLVVESGLKPHDVNALVPVVQGAGGVIGNWTGGDELGGGAVIAAASAALYDQAVALLAR